MSSNIHCFQGLGPNIFGANNSLTTGPQKQHSLLEGCLQPACGPGPCLKPVEGTQPLALQTSTSWERSSERSEAGSAVQVAGCGDSPGTGEDRTRELSTLRRRRCQDKAPPYLDTDSKSDLNSYFTHSTFSRCSDMIQALCQVLKCRPLSSGSSYAV